MNIMLCSPVFNLDLRYVLLFPVMCAVSEVYRALLTVGSIGLVFTEPGWKCVGMF